MSPVLPPASRPQRWKADAPALPSTASCTFSAQSRLPSLPIPPLEQTVSKWKESLTPLAWSSHELESATRKIDVFAQGMGKDLHSRLLKHAEDKEHWLEQWWDDGGYLGYRDSVVVNVSYYYGFKDVPNAPENSIERAALLTRAGMLFREQLKRGEIKPEGTKDVPFCMDTFRWMFDCCRVPGTEGLDWSVSYAKKDSPGSDSGHIIVLRNGHFWRLDMAPKGQLLATEDLARQLRHIVSHSQTRAPGVGILTASNRDVWAQDYAELVSDANNRSSIEAIHSAAFMLCLDANTPDGMIDTSRQLWHGSYLNDGHMGLETRWVDKPINLVVFDNGKSGIMGEHSVMDGTPTVTFCDTVLNMLSASDFDHGTPSSELLQVPQPLEFVISEKTERAIAAARTTASELIESQAMNVHQTAYGKRDIKAFGVSPDSWAQMIVQLAYARLLRSIGNGAKRVGGTYEAATTRRFLKGRTEAIRVVSVESDAWVNAMDDQRKSDVERRELFAAAAKKHVERAKYAGAAQGIDRHLFGLKKVLRDGETMPEVFTDPLVQRSSYWVLSTSAVFSKHFGPYGWGEVVPDGFGVAYMTGFDDYLQYTITSRKEMPNAQFVKEIERAAVDLYNLFSSAKSRL